MLTQRDKMLLSYLENNNIRAITTRQAINIFYNGLDVSAYRRLKQLEQLCILESYMVGKNKVYKLPEDRDISQHDLYILDFYSWIYAQGGEVLEFKKTPHFFKNLLIPDALIKFKIPYEGDMWTVCVLLEIDYKHYTENTKLNCWYEKLWKEQVLKEYCGKAEFPFVVIARPSPGLRYNSKNFNIIYTDLTFNNILPLMLG